MYGTFLQPGNVKMWADRVGEPLQNTWYDSVIYDFSEMKIQGMWLQVGEPF